MPTRATPGLTSATQCALWFERQISPFLAVKPAYVRKAVAEIQDCPDRLRISGGTQIRNAGEIAAGSLVPNDLNSVPSRALSSGERAA